MKIFESKSNSMDNIIDELMENVEKQTNKKVFTLRILKELEDGFETIIIFEDTSVLFSIVHLQDIDGNMGLRIKGDFI